VLLGPEVALLAGRGVLQHPGIELPAASVQGGKVRVIADALLDLVGGLAAFEAGVRRVGRGAARQPAARIVRAVSEIESSTVLVLYGAARRVDAGSGSNADREPGPGFVGVWIKPA
jgi:hypothetical protein